MNLNKLNEIKAQIAVKTEEAKKIFQEVESLGLNQDDTDILFEYCYNDTENDDYDDMIRGKVLEILANLPEALFTIYWRGTGNGIYSSEVAKVDGDRLDLTEGGWISKYSAFLTKEHCNIYFGGGLEYKGPLA